MNCFGNLRKIVCIFLLALLSVSLHASVLSYPNRITFVGDDDVSISAQGNNGVYSASEMVCKAFEKDQHLIFSLQSPLKPVKYVIASWLVSTGDSVKILGDHWERGYGDLEWKALDEKRILPWYFMAYDGTKCNGYGVMTGCRSFCSWRVSPKEIQLVMDVRNGSHGVILNDRILDMATVVEIEGEPGERPFSATQRLCKMMCPNPRLPKEPVYGINDWYFAYGQNSDELIMQTVEQVKDLLPQTTNRPYCMIDAGWACLAPGKKDAGCWSDNFYTPGTNFKDMKKLAYQIKKAGMRPGLWMRPLCAPFGADEKLLLPLCVHPDYPSERFLDPTLNETKAYIRKCFQTYREWGFEMVKHDFSTMDILGKWGFRMLADCDITLGDWRFHDVNHTTAEVILELYQTIRDAAGDDICIIGCNTVSHLAAGLFELQRTGDDTSGKDWGRTLKMGVNTLAFRAPQHMNFYSADSDCVGLTVDIDWNRNKQWMELLALSGTPLFISAQPKAMGPEQRAWIKRCFEIASKPRPVGEPVDWMETLTPSVWNFDGTIKHFDWK